MRFNILSLSGGGYMGLYTAHVLAGLEARSGKPIRESFDLIAGTSVGGIIGLGAALGTPMSEIVSHFEANGAQIFSDRPAPKSFGQVAVDTLRFLYGSKYENKALAQTVSGICGEGTLMEDLPWKFIAPAVNLTQGKPHTFRTPHLVGYSTSRGIRATDVALATSAAPTLLPIVRIGGECFSDGGIYANSPDLIAMHEAESLLRVPSHEIHILSVGTTTSTCEFPEPKSLSFGAFEWMEDRRMLRMALATQQQSAHRILSQRLEHRYLRLDADQDHYSSSLGLDVANVEARSILKDLSSKTLSELNGNMSVDQFLAHQVSPVTFARPNPHSINAADIAV
jgi:uncharacterized protein